VTEGEANECKCTTRRSRPMAKNNGANRKLASGDDVCRMSVQTAVAGCSGEARPR